MENSSENQPLRKRGAKPKPDSQKRKKRTLYLTDAEFGKVEALVESIRREQEKQTTWPEPRH